MILLQKNQPVLQPSAITIGMFDGLHLGHQKLLSALAAQKDLTHIVCTFEPLKTDGVLLTPAEKTAMLRKFSPDYASVRSFTPEFLRITREDYLLSLVKNYNMKQIICGQDFRFGYQAQGDVDYLISMGKRYDFSVHVVEDEYYRDEKISSTRIRACLLRGDAQAAGQMLGKLYSMSGCVMQGKHLGRKLDFPTLNITDQKLIPRFGVYATITEINGALYNGITNVGKRPTVEVDGKTNVETHLFSFSEDLYNQHIRVYFVQHIRDEQTFESKEALSCQVHSDFITAKKILADKNVYKEIKMWYDT